jgi:hypothetical protein
MMKMAVGNRNAQRKTGSLMPLHNGFRMKSHAIDPSSDVPIRLLNIWAQMDNITKCDVQRQSKSTAVQLIKSSRAFRKELAIFVIADLFDRSQFV